MSHSALELAYDRRRAAAMAIRWRSVNACSRCGLPLFTEKYRHCLTCRRKCAKRALKSYYRRKVTA